MIVGLKYAGGAEDFPTRINIGEVVDLRQEPGRRNKPGPVAAYYHGKKVGYLSQEIQGIWRAIKRPARYQAKVVGEITDEDGELAGLDVQISVPSGPKPPPAKPKPRRSMVLRPAVGLTVACLALAVMARAGGVGPPGVGALLFTQESSDMAAANSVASRVPEQQVDDLWRKTEEAAAHRLAFERKEHAESVQMLKQAQLKTQELAGELRRTRESIDRQQQQFDLFRRQTAETAALWRAENLKLRQEISQLRQHISQMQGPRRLAEAREEDHRALRELNLREIDRHANKIRAWNLIGRPAQTARKEPKPAAEIGVPAKKTVVPAEKPATLSKNTQPTETNQPRKANFSRYILDNPDSIPSFSR
jgi:hypothetical protein